MAYDIFLKIDGIDGESCSNTAPPASTFRSPSLSCVKQAAIRWNTSSTLLLT